MLSLSEPSSGPGQLITHVHELTPKLRSGVVEDGVSADVLLTALDVLLAEHLVGFEQRLKLPEVVADGGVVATEDLSDSGGAHALLVKQGGEHNACVNVLSPAAGDEDVSIEEDVADVGEPTDFFRVVGCNHDMTSLLSTSMSK